MVMLLYKTSAKATDGRSVSADGLLDVKLAPPKDLGGPGGAQGLSLLQPDARERGRAARGRVMRR